MAKLFTDSELRKLNPPDHDIPDELRQRMHDKLDEYLNAHQNVVMLSMERNGESMLRSSTCSALATQIIIAVAHENLLHNGEGTLLSSISEKDLKERKN